MKRHLLGPLSVALLALAWAAGPALADQLEPRYPDARQLVATARCYSPQQKVHLEDALGKALNAKVSADTLSHLTVLAMTRGVPADHLVVFYQILRRVRADGLPDLTFASKMAEGMAKGAPSDLIIQVVLEKERNFLRARQLMSASIEHKLLYNDNYYRLLDQTAEALRRGLPPQGLELVLHAGDSLDEIGRGVATYLYLQAIGFPSDVAPDIIVAALQADQLNDCRTCLGQVVLTAKRAGAPPRKVRDDLVRGLKSGRNLGELSRVLYQAPVK